MDAYDRLQSLFNDLDRDMDYYDSEAERPKRLKDRFLRVERALCRVRELIVSEVEKDGE